jgi:tricorn protease
MKRLLFLLAAVLLLAPAAFAREPIRLANNPALSPDGSLLAFDWNGDIWTVPTRGGLARALTRHPARDRQPKFSPDGKEIAFLSDREEGLQVFLMPAEGGTPRQLTAHTSGYTLEDWAPDGKSLLVSSQRDDAWRHANRFFLLNRSERRAEQMLFDDYGQSGCLAPDGKKLLFTREGEPWWRKGYKGSQASQVWLYDRDSKRFEKLLHLESSCRWPLWKPDGKGFYFVSSQNGSANLWEYDLASGEKRQLTSLKDDSVVFPCVSRDGSTIVFRHLFDLYCFRPGQGGEPQKIDIYHDDDGRSERRDRRVLQSATDVAFSADGLEIAFIAGGDLWVMDTELREPRQITNTPEEERFPVFSPDGESILFVSDQGGQCDIWKAERADKKLYWWQNKSFQLERLTNDAEVKSHLKWSPEGSQVAFVKGRGELWVMGPDGKDARALFKGWDRPEFDWSPDGKWIVYARYDSDFNRDIWLLPLDGSRPPFNLSRSPRNEGSPVWSPDGKAIAFAGQRAGPNSEVYFVWLRKDDEEKNQRDRILEKALEKMNRIRQGLRKPEPAPGKDEAGRADDPPLKKGAVPNVVIDFEGIHERIHRISVGDSGASNLFWSPDSKKLAFTASIEGRRGTYTIEVPGNLRPTLLTATTGTHPRWLRQGNQILWLVGGVPASQPGGGGGTGGPSGAASPAAPRTEDPEQIRRFGGGAAPAAPEPSSGGGTSYRFQCLQTVDVGKRNQAVFDLCWRTMRDNWYDERLGNRDWDAVRKKYRDMAARCPDAESVTTVVQLMLGELNGSHLGFTMFERGQAPPPPTQPTPTPTPTPTDPPQTAGRTWNVITPHLGVRFDPAHQGPGLKVRDVLPKGPADQKKSRIEPGEIILAVDGTPVDPSMDLTAVLNGPPARDIVLKVRGGNGAEREVTVRPITYTAARSLLYEKWLDDNRKTVEKLSGGKLGYLHISAMSMPSFYKFEEELYAVGAGKEGLVIDVRENGGGSTADHLLTALTQPVHAITIPRGGEPGYPQDRKVYATWNKPIVVLCNQNSFSNAEIFSHAIKTLKRGQLVGVPTAGGVVSTGAVSIMDVGTLRLPFRGWYVAENGEDMELNGAVPHHVVWPQPGDLPRGKDDQLSRAVEVLQKDVEAWKARPQPPLRKATERQPR